MDELTFLLILAGVGVVLLVAMFTYYKHHKKINDEINDFNHHVNSIDDVLLDENTSDDPFNHDMPSSFSASRNDNFDIDDINFGHESFIDKEQKASSNAANHDAIDKSVKERELVDGVYINTKRVVNSGSGYSQAATESTQHSKPVSSFAPLPNSNESISGTFSDPDDNLTERPPSVTQDNRQVSQEPDDSNNHSASLNENHPSHLNTQTDTESFVEQPSTQQRRVSPVVEKTVSVVSNEAQKIKIVYDPVPEGVEELIISHTILTRGEFFTGEQLFHALDSAGLSYGEMNIYHYPGDGEAESFALFSVANVVEPGTFNPDEPEALKTPGISMFMRLPTRMGSHEAYEEFIHVAQMIASELDGELCDETRSQLTQQAISYKKEQIRKLNFEMSKAEKLAGITH